VCDNGDMDREIRNDLCMLEITRNNTQVCHVFIKCEGNYYIEIILVYTDWQRWTGGSEANLSLLSDSCNSVEVYRGGRQ